MLEVGSPQFLSLLPTLHSTVKWIFSPKLFVYEYLFLMKTSIGDPCLMRILCLGKSCISQVGGVLLFWVLTVVQTIGDNFWNNFWDNIGTNSGPLFSKKKSSTVQCCPSRRGSLVVLGSQCCSDNNKQDQQGSMEDINYYKMQIPFVFVF